MVAADKWLMRAYDDNEGSFNLSIKCFDDIRDKLINGESLSSLLNNNIISEAVAKQIFQKCRVILVQVMIIQYPWKT